MNHAMRWKNKVSFVKQSLDDASSEQPQSIARSPQPDWGNLYEQVVFPNGRPQAATAARSADEDAAVTKCKACGVELTGDEDEQRAHAYTLVHQLAIGASSRAPAAIDRKSKGLRMMERHGYDPDERTGLGAKSEGMHKPIEVKDRTRRAALGSKDEYKKELKRPNHEKTAKIAKKTKGEKRIARRDELDRDSKKHEQWYNELFGR